MKRKLLVYSGLTVLITIFLFSLGCVKQVINTEDTSTQGNHESNVTFDYSVKNGMLVFPTIEDYDKAIVFLAKIEKYGFEKWDEITNFTSQRKLKESGVKNINFVDDNILASLLNKNGEIEIAGKIYKIDYVNRKVYIINNSKTTEQYSFDDDVLFSSAKVKGCPRYSSGVRGLPNYYGYFVAYKKYGIYFTLIAKIKSPTRPVQVMVKYDWTNKSGIHTKTTNWIISEDLYGGANSQYIAFVRPYARTRGLRDYKICTKFYYKNNHYMWKFIDEIHRSCNRNLRYCPL